MDDADARPRLLIIEDDEGLRELFEAFMRRRGFRVACAEDGERGLAEAAAFKPQLIVLDLMMPRLTGLEVVRRLQTSESARVPVIVVTAFSALADTKIILSEPNVVGFLTKPIRYEPLAERIRELLAEPRVAAPPRLGQRGKTPPESSAAS